MKFVAALSYLAVVPTIVSAACTAQQRVATAQNITAAFNEPDFQKSAAEINAMPLTPTCPAIVFVDGAPGIEFGFDSTSTKDFSNVVRQAFVNVVANYTDYDNGTLLMDAIVTLGVLHEVQLPIYAHILVPIEFDLTSCLISKLPAHVNVPTDIAGQPVQNPMLPTIPGLATLPGFAEVLAALAGQGLSPGKELPLL